MVVDRVCFGFLVFFFGGGLKIISVGFFFSFLVGFLVVVVMVVFGLRWIFGGGFVLFFKEKIFIENPI